MTSRVTHVTTAFCFVPANITRWTGIANVPARIVKSEKRCGAVRKSHLFMVVGTDAGEIVALKGTEISTTIPAVPCWEAMENASRSTVFHDGMRSTCRICPSIVVSVKRNSPSTLFCRPVWLFFTWRTKVRSANGFALASTRSEMRPCFAEPCACMFLQTEEAKQVRTRG